MINNNFMVQGKDHPILFTEPTLHNKENRVNLAQLMFEKYQLPAMFICKSSVLAAFSCGRSTCLVFDSGHNSVYATPVHDGYALQKSNMKFEIAGNYITNEIIKIVESKGNRVIPHYKFTKEKIEDHFVTNYTKEPLNEDPTYENFWRREICRDLKESVISVNEEPLVK